ncbi:MAG: hypothetical protein CVT60_02855 [Actinobacteria bacterium HGW-Actinobacteria-10]|nr:MAG: hypothetical protein CVT60_02855 [Actinobacteria bacterium HGW-Actinobacteria-10]
MHQLWQFTHGISTRNPIKFQRDAADIQYMIISREQVQRAVEYLRTPAGSKPAITCGPTTGTVSPELLQRVQKAVESCPDMRQDRIERGRALIGDCPTSNEVAEKIIGRILSDSVR